MLCLSARTMHLDDLLHTCSSRSMSAEMAVSSCSCPEAPTTFLYSDVGTLAAEFEQSELSKAGPVRRLIEYLRRASMASCMSLSCCSASAASPPAASSLHGSQLHTVMAVVELLWRFMKWRNACQLRRRCQTCLSAVASVARCLRAASRSAILARTSGTGGAILRVALVVVCSASGDQRQCDQQANHCHRQSKQPDLRSTTFRTSADALNHLRNAAVPPWQPPGQRHVCNGARRRCNGHRIVHAAQMRLAVRPGII
jgi:hypothetical protein